MSLTDGDRWYTLYPIYFDKKRSISEGRRIPSALALENPSASAIAEAVKILGNEAILEADKRHPRSFDEHGRVKVKLSGLKKNQLLLGVAKILPTVKISTVKTETVSSSKPSAPHASTVDSVSMGPSMTLQIRKKKSKK